MRTLSTLIIFLVILTFQGFAQPLNGTYTIGGASPDFPTIVSAVSSLTTNGVSGPVVFNIRSGIYNEKIQLTAFNGSSNINTVTFKSETNNQNDVSITDEHTAVSTLNYTLYLDGVDNVIFKHLTIEARQSTTIANLCRVVYIFNDANNIRLEDNIIKSFYLNYGDDSYSAITAGVGGFTAGTFRDNDSLFVLRNKIIGGYYAVASYGQSKTLTTHRFIEENECSNQYMGGIYLSMNNENYVSKNRVTQSQPNSSYIGIRVNDTERTMLINANSVTLTNGSKGVDLFIVNKTTGFISLVSNNALKLNDSGAANSAGIANNQVKQVTLANNTIEINKTGNNTTSCISFSNGDSLFVRNNIFVSKGNGYSYFSSGSPIIISSNNNHFSQPSAPIASISGTVYNTLNNLQSGLSIEINSVYANPALSGSENIIPSGIQIYNGGIPVSGISTDFFGNTRSLTTPCIGAYEGVLPTVNAAVTFSNFSGNNYCPLNNYPLSIRISNYGQSALTNAQIHFNGSVINWTGNLAPMQESVDISLGTWFVPRTFIHTLPPISITLPNGQVDNLTSNDTLTVTITPRLTGNYFVGGGTPDFTTISEVSSRLSTNGICDNVVVNIADGTYNEQVVFQNISGLSPTSQLTFQSMSLDSSTVTCTFNITSTSANYIWQFKNLSYITIQRLTFTPVVNNSFKRVLAFESGRNIVLSNNRILNGGIAFFSRTSPTGKISILNNYATNAVDVSSNASTNGDNKITVDGTPTNLIDSVVISGNVLLGTNTRDFFINNTNYLSIFKNELAGTRSQVTLDLDTCGFISIYKNKLAISSNQILLDFVKCTNSINSPGLVHSNFILGTGGSHSGIRVQSSTNIHFYHNTVRTQSYAIIFSIANSGLVCKNNIFHATNNNAMYYLNSTLIPSVVSEYNNLYSLSANTILVNSTGLNVTVFQQTYFNEYNSFYAAPIYTSTTNLHLMNNSIPQDGVGIAIPGMVDDIDGETISTYPDIGADQFELNYALFDNNIRLVAVLNPNSSICTGDNSLKIRVKNVSDDVVNSFTVKWFLFNTQMNQFVANQTLNPNDSIDITVGSYPFNGNTFYDLMFNISLPNGVPDIYSVDNTLSKAYYFPGSFQIETRKVNDCSNQKELFIPVFPNSSILWSTGETSPSIIVSSPGTYSVTVQYPGGCSSVQSILIN